MKKPKQNKLQSKNSKKAETTDRRYLFIVIGLGITGLLLLLASQLLPVKSDLKWAEQRLSNVKSGLSNGDFTDMVVKKYCFHNQQGPLDKGKLNCGVSLVGRFQAKDISASEDLLNSIRIEATDITALNSKVRYDRDSNIPNEKDMNCSLVHTTLNNSSQSANETLYESVFNLSCSQTTWWQFYETDERRGSYLVTR